MVERHKDASPTQAGRTLRLAFSSAHNDIRHHGVYTIIALLSKQYLWPGMGGDIAWYIGTCHVCQQQTTQQSYIPPIVAMPAPLFSKVYLDTMHMPSSSGYKYII